MGNAAKTPSPSGQRPAHTSPAQRAGFFVIDVSRVINVIGQIRVIALQYLQGHGVPCDLSQAKLWLHRLLLAAPEKSSSRREAAKLLRKLNDQFI